MNVSECCTCPHTAMPRGRCLCVCHRSIERDRCRCGYIRQQCHCATGTDNPIADFAAALNPPGGALADALPFTLAAPAAPRQRPAETQTNLFETEPNT